MTTQNGQHPNDIFYRVKRVFISMEWFVSTLCRNQGKVHPFDTIDAPCCKAIPEGCQVLGVHFDGSRRGAELLICHPSFPKVAQNETPPELDPDMMWFRYVPATQEELLARPTPTIVEPEEL